MKKIALFIKDFKTATKVSEKLGDLNLEIQFCETDFNGAIDFSLAIIDLNESDFANNEFITKLKKDANVFIIGFVSKVVKKTHDAFKLSGCNIILSNASIIKNIERLVREGLK